LRDLLGTTTHFEVLKKPVGATLAVQQVPDVPDLRELLSHAIRETARDSSWSRLATVGGLINKTHSSFDPRNYGFKKLNELVRSQACVEVADKADSTGLFTSKSA
jgi:OST-HTH/LOTUS domain